jgi:serine/threonine protein phosphatase PrpC
MEQQPEKREQVPEPALSERQVKSYTDNSEEGQKVVVGGNISVTTIATVSSTDNKQLLPVPKEPVPVQVAPVAPAPTPVITFSNLGGTFSVSFILKLNCSVQNVALYYTTDGTEPDLKSNKYSTQGITVDRSVTIKARAAINEQLCREIFSEQYNFVVGRVKFSIDEGTHNPPLTLALSSVTDGTTIFYTLDGSDPTNKSNKYDHTDSLLLRSTVTVKAIAYKEGWQPCEICIAKYELKAPQWLELEPADQQDSVPHKISDSMKTLGGWNIIAASVRGKLHAHRALWRDDSYNYATEGPWTIIAVSDGAGSVPLSRIGSHIACEIAKKHLISLLNNFIMQEPADAVQPDEKDLIKLRLFLKDAAQNAKNEIGEEARKRNCPVNHFAATLLVMIHCKWKSFDFVAAIQVGDGAIALWNQDDTASLLGVADHGEHSSETKFLTTKNIENEFEHRVLFTLKEKLRGIAIMTDGVSDDFFPEDKRIIELFNGRAIPAMSRLDDSPVDGVGFTVIPAEKPDEALLEWLKYSKKGSSDDRTLLLFYGDNK